MRLPTSGAIGRRAAVKQSSETEPDNVVSNDQKSSKSYEDEGKKLDLNVWADDHRGVGVSPGAARAKNVPVAVALEVPTRRAV